MRLFYYALLCCIGFGVQATEVYAQDKANCPGPLFDCNPWGPGGPGPGGPPGPIFQPVTPHLENYVDFNRNYAVIEGGELVVKKGSPDLSPDVSEFLNHHRQWIDPNGTYLLAPESVVGDVPLGSGLIIGGGALTQ